MLKKLVISLFLLVSVGTFGQQKANYELAERFRRITQMPLTKNSLEVILVLLITRIVFVILSARVRVKTII